MAIDATGTPTTNYSIPKFNTTVDAPSGKGGNAQMDFIDNLLKTGFIPNPAGLVTDDVPVWNGAAWVRPSGTPSATTYLRGDGTWSTPGVTTIFDVVIGRGLTGDPASPGMPDSNTILGGNIPQTYKHLRVEVCARTDFVATSDLMAFRFNGDAGANYDYQKLRGSATVVSSSEGFAQTALPCGLTACASTPASLFATTVIDIPNYTDATMNKTIVTTSQLKIGTASGNIFVETYAGSWRSNAAITRINWIPFSGGTGFVAASRWTLYGIN